MIDQVRLFWHVEHSGDPVAVYIAPNLLRPLVYHCVGHVHPEVSTIGSLVRGRNFLMCLADVPHPTDLKSMLTPSIAKGTTYRDRRLGLICRWQDLPEFLVCKQISMDIH